MSTEVNTAPKKRSILFRRKRPLSTDDKLGEVDTRDWVEKCYACCFAFARIASFVLSILNLIAVLFIVPSLFSDVPGGLILKLERVFTFDENATIPCRGYGVIVEDFQSKSEPCPVVIEQDLLEKLDYKQYVLNSRKSGKWISLAFLRSISANSAETSRCTTGMQILEQDRDAIISYKNLTTQWTCPRLEKCCNAGCCEKDDRDTRILIDGMRKIVTTYSTIFVYITLFAHFVANVFEGLEDNKYYARKDAERKESERQELDSEDSDCESLAEWDKSAFNVTKSIDDKKNMERLE